MTLMRVREYYVIQDKQSSQCISEIGESIDDIDWDGYYSIEDNKFVDCFKFNSLEEAMKTINKFPVKSLDEADVVIDDLIIFSIDETITQKIIEDVKQEIKKVKFKRS